MLFPYPSMEGKGGVLLGSCGWLRLFLWTCFLFPPHTSTEEVLCNEVTPGGNNVQFSAHDVIRRYHDTSKRCSSFCLCQMSRNLMCYDMGCMEDSEKECSIPNLKIGFGSVYYHPSGSGPCTCIAGKFICERVKGMKKSDLGPGIFFFVAYSYEDMQWLRNEVYEQNNALYKLVTTFDASSTGAPNDVASALQEELVKIRSSLINASNTQADIPNCQISLYKGGGKSNPKQEQLVMIVKVFQNQKWVNGGPERVCNPMVQRLYWSIKNEEGARFQLRISPIKHIALVNNLQPLEMFNSLCSLPPLPPALFSLFLFVFCCRLLATHK